MLDIFPFFSDLKSFLLKFWSFSTLKGGGGREGEEESKQGSKRRNTDLQKAVDIFIVWRG